MKVKQHYKIIVIGYCAIIVILGFTAFRGLSIRDELTKSVSHRHNSYKLALELFHSSEDLTRMARKYVVTGNPEYEKNYFEILDIRNGVLPRPNDYTGTYWHLHSHKPDEKIEGTKIPLKDLMIEKGIKKEELLLLDESQKNSDHLVLLEKRAFAAMKGIFPDQNGDFTIQKEPDQDLAISLLFNDEYMQEKEKIMQPIKEFIDRMEKKNEQQIENLEAKMRNNIIAAIACLSFSIIGMIKWSSNAMKYILNPIHKIHKHVDAIMLGNLRSRCKGIPQNEIGELAEHINTMADNLESDMKIRTQAEKIIRESEEKMRLMLNSAGEAMYGIDINGNCTFANPTCVTVLGYDDSSELLGKNMHDLIHHSWPDGEHMYIRECKVHKALFERKGIHIDDEVFFKKDGSRFEVEYWSYPIIDDNMLNGAVINFRDISEQKRMQEEIIEESHRLTDILHGSKVGTWEWRFYTDEVTVDDTLLSLMGYERSELPPLTGENFKEYIHPDDIGTIMEFLDNHIKKGTHHFECEIRIKHKTGKWIWMLDRGQVTERTIRGEAITMAGTMTDIMKRKEEEERIRFMATHDLLTSVPNRGLAKDRFNMAAHSSERQNTGVAIMFIDLDGFKPVNDTYGHDAGDEVLKEVANRLGSNVRKSDTVARIGGDEFVLIITNIKNKPDLVPLAEKILASLHQEIIFKNHKIRVGASIGIAFYPDNGEEFDCLIKSADDAMYKIKTAGKNGFTFAGNVVDSKMVSTET